MGGNCVFQLVSAFTVKEWLPDLLTLFYDDLKIKKHEITMLVINSPAGLTFSSLPPKYREIVISDLLDIQNQFKNHDNPKLKNNIDELITNMNYEKYDYEMLLRGKRKIAILDKAKKTDLRSLHPLYKELLDYEE